MIRIQAVFKKLYLFLLLSFFWLDATAVFFALLNAHGENYECCDDDSCFSDAAINKGENDDENTQNEP